MMKHFMFNLSNMEFSPYSEFLSSCDGITRVVFFLFFFLFFFCFFLCFLKLFYSGICRMGG